MGNNLNYMRRRMQLGAQPHKAKASGAVATFRTNLAARLDSLFVDVTPVQDLHGYDYPWPSGGGVNKCPSPLQTTITKSGLTFTCDGKGECSLSGTVSSGAVFDLLIDEVVLPSTVYVHLFNSNYYSENTPIIDFMNGSTMVDFVGINVTQNRIYNGTSDMGGKTINGIRIRVPSGFTGSVTFKLYISDSDAVVDFSPYSNICPITGWTGCNVFKTGVNVWDEEWEVGGINGKTGGNWKTSDRIRSKNYIPVKPSTNYFLKSPTNVNVMFYGDNKDYISSIFYYPSDNNPFTTPANCAFVRFAEQPDYGTTYNHDISINYPATDTAYHAYTGQTYPISWQTEAGTVYGGTLTVNNDGTCQLVVDHGLFKPTLTTRIARQPGRNNYYFNVVIPGVDSNALVTEGIISNILQANTFTMVWNGYENCCCLRVGGFSFYTDETKQKTESEALEWLVNHDAEIYFPLATPVTYQLDPIEIKTLLGVNNVWSDCGNVDLSYWTNV